MPSHARAHSLHTRPLPAHTTTTPRTLHRGPSIHLFDFRAEGGAGGGGGGSGGARGGSAQTFEGPGGAITAACLHEGDAWALFGATETGGVVSWDMRDHTTPLHVLPGLHAGPVLGLCVGAEGGGGVSGGGAEGGGALFSSGDDGVVRRVPLVGGAHVAGEVEPGVALRCEAPLRGVAWLTNWRQRQAGAGEGVLAAASATGAVEWGVVQ